MEVALDLSNLETTGSVVGERHFGLNFVADYERIGTKGWEKFDDIVDKMGIRNVRYPGGTAAETVFDYKNPNATEYIATNGETVKITPLATYLDYCNRAGINPTIIIPTSSLLTETRVDSHRAFDAAQTSDLINFIEQILAQVDPQLRVSFELGNEYESYMSSTEYGRVANALTGIIGDASNRLAESTGYTEQAPDPNIFVQAWAYSVGGGTTISELEDRNNQVLAQFDSDLLGDIDGIVSHYYFSEGRNAETDQAQTLLEISDQIARIADLHSVWEDASGKELISRVSEWNVLFRSQTELGLLQVNPIMEMFTEFLRNDFDALDFWSAQYHATSIATASGRLMAAGVLLDVLKPNIQGAEVGATVRTDGFSAYTFIGNGRYVAVISSTTIEDLRIDLGTSLLPEGFKLVDGYSIGVDESTADGIYRDLTDLPVYGEPDARITLTQITMSLITGNIGTASLGSFESLVLIFTLDEPVRQTIYGTDNADLLHGTEVSTLFVGGLGWDQVTYVSSGSAVDVDLAISPEDGSYNGDLFISIEAITGSSFADTILGSDENDFIEGWLGSDIIAGRDGDERLSGGGGDDTLFGGSGNDELYGGDGDDLILPGSGQDVVSGGNGVDTISFADLTDGVSIWVDRGIVETPLGIVKFSGIENFFGTAYDDRIDIGTKQSIVDGLAGDDSFMIRVGGEHLVFGGGGDDHLVMYAGSAEFYGGEGNDKVFAAASTLVQISGGAGDDTVYSFGGSGIFEGGEGNDTFYTYGSGDEFIFSSDAGHDVIYGFNPEQDVIRFRGDQVFTLVEEDGGSMLFFDSGSSVMLMGFFAESPDELQYFFF